MALPYRPQRSDDPQGWSPRRISRVLEVIPTSTLPVKVVTDDGLALLKYMGNRQGVDALISELVAARLAVLFDIFIPQFCVMRSPLIAALGGGAVEGPAFVSRWIGSAITAGPNSPIMAKLRSNDSISSLVVFDTWIKNFDRGAPIGMDRISNFDNLLFVPDKRKVEMVAIDHTHAFVERSFDDDLYDGWCNEETAYGLFSSFASRIQRFELARKLNQLASIDEDAILDAIGIVPQEWEFSARKRALLARQLSIRAQLMSRWMPDVLFSQAELDLGGNP